MDLSFAKRYYDIMTRWSIWTRIYNGPKGVWHDFKVY